MNQGFVTRITPSVVAEPDYVGNNGTQSNPIKMFTVIFIVSIAICSIAMNQLASYLTPMAHVFWLVFHTLYIGGLLYFFVQKWKQYTQGLEV